VTRKSKLVSWIEIPVAHESCQELGLIASWLEVQLNPLDDGVDDALAAVADQFAGILAATFEGEDQGGCRYCDDGAERGGQGHAYGKMARTPRRCCLTAVEPSLFATRRQERQTDLQVTTGRWIARSTG